MKKSAPIWRKYIISKKARLIHQFQADSSNYLISTID